MIPVRQHHHPRPLGASPTDYGRYALAFLLLFAAAAGAALVSASPIVWLVAAVSGAASVGYRFAEGIDRARRADAALYDHGLSGQAPAIPRQRSGEGDPASTAKRPAGP